uniref:Uncharacterized protein n=1 Tax=Oryzias latipes TaxID=8090 RepID=A0A3P9IDU4_ORYLA
MRTALTEGLLCWTDFYFSLCLNSSLWDFGFLVPAGTSCLERDNVYSDYCRKDYVASIKL